ncbi:hypothetical protein C8R45DRAFT_114478 [Mycena sanguinolenta]|nr:hypothetical protein C8R45DRAFT_114478 [Mycena sanguinolenta]
MCWGSLPGVGSMEVGVGSEGLAVVMSAIPSEVLFRKNPIRVYRFPRDFKAWRGRSWLNSFVVGYAKYFKLVVLPAALDAPGPEIAQLNV